MALERPSMWIEQRGRQHSVYWRNPPGLGLATRSYQRRYSQATPPLWREFEDESAVIGSTWTTTSSRPLAGGGGRMAADAGEEATLSWPEGARPAPR